MLANIAYFCPTFKTRTLSPTVVLNQPHSRVLIYFLAYGHSIVPKNRSSPYAIGISKL